MVLKRSFYNATSLIVLKKNPISNYFEMGFNMEFRINYPKAALLKPVTIKLASTDFA